MNRAALSRLREFGTRIGLDINRWPRPQSIDYTRSRVMSRNRVQTVLDVGANRGQWGLRCRRLGFTEGIVSFEPLVEPRKRLMSIANADGKWSVVPQALGSRSTSQAHMFVSGNAQMSSSLREMLPAHVSLAPSSKYTGSEVVSVSRLDDVWPSLKAKGPIYMKIDVQGHELDVLLGASQALQSMVAVEVEVSLEPMYLGQPDFLEVDTHLRASGFRLCAIEMGLVDQASGSAMTVDAIWIINRRMVDDGQSFTSSLGDGKDGYDRGA
jgi:FkbM family methyltransferase